MLFVIVITALLLGALPVARSQAWLDRNQTVDERVALLLAAMSNAEKQAQTIHTTGCSLDECVAAFGKTGIGAIPQEGTDGPSIIARRNLFQGALMNNSRLHIPVSFHQETLHGANAGVIFPMPASQGASFNAELVRSIAAVIAVEASATVLKSRLGQFRREAPGVLAEAAARRERLAP